MATRSYIGVKNTDGTVDYIYCHFDGYPEHNGKILTENYTSMDKVNALMRLGDLSILAPEIGEKQDFNDRTAQNSNWCLAYGRDRGETNVSVANGTYNDLINDHDVDYVYIFDGEYWECFDTYTSLPANLYNSVPAGT
jgi:hypothetical protein